MVDAPICASGCAIWRVLAATAQTEGASRLSLGVRFATGEDAKASGLAPLSRRARSGQLRPGDGDLVASTIWRVRLRG